MGYYAVYRGTTEAAAFVGGMEEARDIAPWFSYAFELWQLGDPADMNHRHYFLGGTVYFLDGMEARGEYPELVAEMRRRGISTVIRCRDGQFRPFRDGDRYVPVPPVDYGATTHLN